MSSLALMRFLEATPERYDAGMRWVTLGRVDRLHDALARAAVPTRSEPGRGPKVLEIGCGTGAVTARLLARGAVVTALDQNPEMLERARARIDALDTEARRAVSWLERSASEIDALPEGGFDVVVASLCLSEMSAGERRFVLREAALRLGARGRVVVADEVRPVRRWERVVVAMLRAPQAVLAWALAGSLSRPIPELRAELERAGLAVVGEERWLLGSLALFCAERAR